MAKAKKQPKKTPAPRGGGKRAATVDPQATVPNTPRTPAGTPSRRSTRSSTTVPDSHTAREATQDTTPSTATALKDAYVGQNVAELIVTRPEYLQPTIEGQSPSLGVKLSTSQGRAASTPSKSVDRALSSGITKGAPRGSKSDSRSRSRVPAADTSSDLTPAPPKTRTAAMLEQLRERERETANAIEHLSTAIKEAKTTGKEARAVLKQVNKLTLEARDEALAMTERALAEKEEAEDAKKEALEIGEKYRPVSYSEDHDM